MWTRRCACITTMRTLRHKQGTRSASQYLVKHKIAIKETKQVFVSSCSIKEGGEVNKIRRGANFKARLWAGVETIRQLSKLSALWPFRVVERRGGGRGVQADGGGASTFLGSFLLSRFLRSLSFENVKYIRHLVGWPIAAITDNKYRKPPGKSNHDVRLPPTRQPKHSSVALTGYRLSTLAGVLCLQARWTPDLPCRLLYGSPVVHRASEHLSACRRHVQSLIGRLTSWGLNIGSQRLVLARLKTLCCGGGGGGTWSPYSHLHTTGPKRIRPCGSEAYQNSIDIESALLFPHDFHRRPLLPHFQAMQLALVVFHCCGSIRSASWHGRSSFTTVLMMNSAKADPVKVHDGIAHRRRNTFHG